MSLQKHDMKMKVMLYKWFKYQYCMPAFWYPDFLTLLLLIWILYFVTRIIICWKWTRNKAVRIPHLNLPFWGGTVLLLNVSGNRMSEIVTVLQQWRNKFDFHATEFCLNTGKSALLSKTNPITLWCLSLIFDLLVFTFGPSGSTEKIKKKAKSKGLFWHGFWQC